MSLVLRRAGPADAPAIRALTRAAYAPWVAVIGREPMPMTADYDHAVRAHWIDLHEPDGMLIALIETIPQPDHLLIENIAVRPDRHGQGLGGALLAHAATLAQTAGLAELRLYTNAAFAKNLAYYARRGFAETHRAPSHLGGHVVHFRKPLTPVRGSPE
jgi:N-acetylglutamate synthase-like GNAT family acetyltransferase